MARTEQPARRLLSGDFMGGGTLADGDLRLFPAEAGPGEDAEEEGEKEEHADRREGARETDAAPGHGVEAVDRPAGREEERRLLEPGREDERRYPGSAEHDEEQRREHRDAARGLRRLADRRDQQAERRGH